MWRKTIAVVVVGIVGWSSGVAEAGVWVVADAAQSGAYGLRATVAPQCSGEQNLTVSGAVEQDTEAQACNEILVDADVASPARLRVMAGQRVSFASGFSIGEGAALVAGVDEALQPGYAVDATPALRAALTIGWSERFDAVVPGASVTTLEVFSPGGPRGWVRYDAQDIGGVLRVEAAEEDGRLVRTQDTWLAPGWHRVGIRWDAGRADAATGGVSLTIDGVTVAAVSSLDLKTAVIERIAVGVVDASSAGGWVDIDDYETRE